MCEESEGSNHVLPHLINLIHEANNLVCQTVSGLFGDTVAAWILFYRHISYSILCKKGRESCFVLDSLFLCFLASTLRGGNTSGWHYLQVRTMSVLLKYTPLVCR